jgi:mannitol/fructose-specific phosphotransferase system IIA component (Ntr-type)
MCAVDHDSHLEMLAELAAILGDSDAVNFMLNAGDTEQIRELF